MCNVMTKTESRVGRAHATSGQLVIGHVMLTLLYIHYSNYRTDFPMPAQPVIKICIWSSVVAIQ